MSAIYEAPRTIRVDNGPEFVSNDLFLWACENRETLYFSRDGKPADNALVESFNARLRNECLYRHRCLSADDARAKTET